MKVDCAHDALVEIEKLVPNPKNPNEHPKKQINLLAKIMRHQGVRAPIVVSNRSGFITKGHGRREAAIVNKWTHYPVDFQDYATEADEYADMVADNKIAELAESNMGMIIGEAVKLGEGFDFDLLGIPDFELPTVEAPGAGTEDHVPENVEPKTKPGDLYQMGPHRLLCGDTTNVQHVQKLLSGEKFEMVFTDPPYGNKDSGKYGRSQLGHRTIQGDSSLEAFKDSLKAIMPERILYFLQWRTLAEALPFILELGLETKTVGVWDKKNAGLGHGMAEQWEAFSFAGPIKFKKFGGNVFSISREVKARIDSPHPHQKPVELLEQLMEFIPYKKLLDPFGGSGSTLIACEKTGRTCFMMEIEPRYCDVIVARWEKYSGNKAELISEKQP